MGCGVRQTGVRDPISAACQDDIVAPSLNLSTLESPHSKDAMIILPVVGSL